MNPEPLPATNLDPIPEEEDRPYDLEGLPPMVRRSQEAFRRDLPELMKTRRRQWVAYHGDQRIGFGRSQVKLGTAPK